jgi:hypothetical protein
VNGRPVFADAFFNPIEDRLIAIAAMPDRAEARRALVAVVSREFKETVDSELVVAEAESQLSPEQQEGLFAWLRSLQEETIAQRGGSRASAEQSLESESAMSLDEFLEVERDKALAGRLLNQRIEPRTIVSWRDVVQEYERREAEFNPPPAIRIGRIRLDLSAEADSVAKVRAMIAEGKRFSEIAREINLAEGGFWNRYELPATGIAGLALSDAIKQRLSDLKVDQVSEPIEANAPLRVDGREVVHHLGVLVNEGQVAGDGGAMLVERRERRHVGKVDRRRRKRVAALAVAEEGAVHRVGTEGTRRISRVAPAALRARALCALAHARVRVARSVEDYRRGRGRGA